jgi:hypothetical protein
MRLVRGGGVGLEKFWRLSHKGTCENRGKGRSGGGGGSNGIIIGD